MAKRLRPLTDDRPKCLLALGGRTLLERACDALRSHDIHEWVVVTGYRGGMIRDFLTAHYPDALSVCRHPLGDEEMKVVVDGDGHITEISKTCRPEEAIGESVGIEKMTPSYTTALYAELEQMMEREGLVDIFYERAFERLIPQGHTFRVVDTTAYLSYELDTVEDFLHANELIKNEQS